jgi:ADP-ribosylglycohydrolase
LTNKQHIPTINTTVPLENAVVNSALWAAAGDALGWITELSRGRSTVKRRVGSEVVMEPVAWQRIIGGRNGPTVDLPSGTYSDDTQLRLAVSRSIRGNGTFDVETFAKIELPVWPTYALGGGLGTKAAAISLSRRSTNWFSNFFESKDQKYVSGGGNGAAMRIQPHVWASTAGTDKLILDVLKDALVTHGHPHGFCGAVFHALALSHTLENGEVPSPDIWFEFVNRFADLPEIISLDPQLAAFWISAWENCTGTSLTDALDNMLADACKDINSIVNLMEDAEPSSYQEVLRRLGCLTMEFRGSGFKTALAALALSYMYREGSIEEALRCAANELESDTDTIGTMTGAILGSLSVSPPAWTIQDRDYIIKEARRLASIAVHHSEDSFAYPDIGLWNPPVSQVTSIGKVNGGLAIVGLGNLEPISREYLVGDAIWQWFRLTFGQTILAKRKSKSLATVSVDQLPRERRPVRAASDAGEMKCEQESLLIPCHAPSAPAEVDSTLSDNKGQSDQIDLATDEIITSNFDDLTLGRVLNRVINSTQSVEIAIAISAIIAKAKIARQRRRR